VPLPGDGLLTVRPVTLADVDGLVALYDGLSREDRYRRFFRAGGPSLAAPRGGAAIAIDDDEPQLVVDLVDRLASAHQGAAANRQVSGPKGRSTLE
jgi:hypothetical protein